MLFDNVMKINNKLTIILPLWDREIYTPLWIKNNIFEDFNYIIADGSKTDNNQAIFNDLKENANIDYIRYTPDLNVRDYLEKMSDAASRVQTPFVMNCDNDDFINYNGVINCITALEDNEDASCAGGPIFGVKRKSNSRGNVNYTLPEKIKDLSDYSGMCGYEGLAHLYKDYKYTWYSIFRKKINCTIWSDILQNNLTDIFLVELLHSQLSFVYGKYVHVKHNHYIRLLNPESSCAQGSSAQIPHTQKIFFDEVYRDQVIRMSEYISKSVGVEISDLLSELKYYYISSCSKRSPLCAERIYKTLSQLYSSIPRRLNIYFPIEFVILVANTFVR